PSLDNFQQEIPPELERIIYRCLAKTPGERFQSARDLAFDLRSLLTSTSGMYRAASGAYRQTTAEIRALPTGPQRLSMRPAWWIFGVLSLALTVALGAVILMWWRSRHTGAPPRTSLAVLPLANESGDKSVEVLSDGISESIITNLS